MPPQTTGLGQVSHLNAVLNSLSFLCNGSLDILQHSSRIIKYGSALQRKNVWHAYQVAYNCLTAYMCSVHLH